jgi:hypothetical protein
LPPNTLALKLYWLYRFGKIHKKYVYISAISTNLKEKNLKRQVKTEEYAGGMPQHARHE